MKETHNLEQLKISVAEELKHLSLLKKDRNFLLSLIELFDWLSENEEDRFLAKLEKMVSEKKNENDEELKIRLHSLQTQLNNNKNLKITHFPAFSMYFQAEKIDIYIKKLPVSWDELISEIEKLKFNYILITVYKSVTKKEKILSEKLNQENWKESLLYIFDRNVFSNIKIAVFIKKQKL